MARSTYIYVVLEKHDLVIAFTVKYELAIWLRRQVDRPYFTDYVVERIKDGKPVELGGSTGMGTAEQFLQDNP
jgi:hypothetical protein